MHSAFSYPAWQVRISAPDGRITGGGVALPEDTILTCAHVVGAALAVPCGPGSAPPGPDAAVEVEVAGRTGVVRRTARVVARAWDTRVDTALLVLDPAPAAPSDADGGDCADCAAGPEPAPLVAAMDRVERGGSPLPVLVKGHPSLFGGNAGHGLLVRGEVVGYGVAPGAAQLNLDAGEPIGITPGFSGCGVRSAEAGGIVGIVCSALTGGGPGAEGRLAAMVPVESIPAVAHLVADPGRAQAQEALGSLGFAAAVPAFRSAMRSRPLEPADFPTAREAFAYLCGLAPTADGLPRESVFTEELAKAGGPGSAALRAYADTRPVGEVPPHALRRLRAEPAPVPFSAARVEVITAPVLGTGDAPARYEVRSRVRADEAATAPHTARVDEAGVPGAVCDAVADAERLIGRGPYPPPTPLTLDLYLPLRLLADGAAATWRMPAPGGGPGPRLGSAHRVVLHSYERAFADDWGGARIRLRTRLARMTDSGRGLVHGFAAGGPADSAGAHDRLADPRIAVCTVDEAATWADGGGPLLAALAAGVPTVVWRIRDSTGGAHGTRAAPPREAADPAHGSERPLAAPRFLDRLIYRGSGSLSLEEIGDLPRRLHELRIDSARSDISDPGPAGSIHPFDIAMIADDAECADSHSVSPASAPEALVDSE